MFELLVEVVVVYEGTLPTYLCEAGRITPCGSYLYGIHSSILGRLPAPTHPGSTLYSVRASVGG